MKLEQFIPEYPFDDYEKAYVSYHKDGRKIIQLVNFKTRSRKTTSYARYRLSVLLKRKISDDEEVDHRDNNCRNDSDNNLQLLTKKQNLDKQAEIQKIELILLECPECQKSYFVLPSEYSKRSKKGKRKPYCNRSCSSKASIRIGVSPTISSIVKNSVPIERVSEMLKLRKEKWSFRKIAKHMKINHKTVHYHVMRHMSNKKK